MFNFLNSFISIKSKEGENNGSCQNVLEVLNNNVNKGKVYDLGIPLKNFMPHAPLHPPFIFAQFAMHNDYVFGDEGASASNDMIVMTTHDGTHLDAIGHISKHGKLYGGVDALKVQHGQLGLSEHGIDKVDPIICRGVLFDVPGYKKVDILPAGYGISDEDLKNTAEKQGVQLNPGDIALIRTGWINHIEDKEKYGGHDEGCPGVNMEGAKWLADQKIYQTGNDTLAYEVWPSPSIPVHVFLIAENGIAIMEMLYLEDLAKDQVYEFRIYFAPLENSWSNSLSDQTDRCVLGWRDFRSGNAGIREESRTI